MPNVSPSQQFIRSRAGIVGLLIVGLLVVFALAFPLVSTHDPYTSDFARGVSASGGPAPPGPMFLLGTDRIFRDELVRLAYGARLSLFIAVAATLLSTFVGGTVGIVAGFFGGATDFALMRVVDVGLAFPFLLLVMAIGAALGQTTPTTVLLVLGLTGWLGSARIVRSKTIQLRHEDFVLAARALGQSSARILFLHILPNVAGQLSVLATLSVAQMIVAESVLSYLGAGIAPPVPTWGHMLYEGQDAVLLAPWLLLAPGVAILVSVLGFNLIGEGLRDVFDARQLGAR